MTRFLFFTSIASLFIACCLALILVMAKTPFTAFLFDDNTFQHILVLHVNFSLFIWLFMFAGALGTDSFKGPDGYYVDIVKSLLLLGFIGLVITIFVDNAHPVLNNYLPVLNHPLYWTAIWLFYIGFILFLLTLSRNNKKYIKLDNESSDYSLSSKTSLYRLLLVMLLCLIVLPLSAIALEQENVYYFEMLFWGIGHQMQYIFMLLMLWVWAWLLEHSQVASKHLPACKELHHVKNRLNLTFSLALVPLIISLFPQTF